MKFNKFNVGDRVKYRGGHSCFHGDQATVWDSQGKYDFKPGCIFVRFDNYERYGSVPYDCHSFPMSDFELVDDTPLGRSVREYIRQELGR